MSKVGGWVKKGKKNLLTLEWSLTVLNSNSTVVVSEGQRVRTLLLLPTKLFSIAISCYDNKNQIFIYNLVAPITFDKKCI